jgi:hypothetical protein
MISHDGTQRAGVETITLLKNLLQSLVSSLGYLSPSRFESTVPY